MPVMPVANKTKRLVMASETTLGTIATFGTASLVVPGSDIALDYTRGTQIVARDSVMDGYGGEMCGVPGSFGSNVSFSTEVHDIDGNAAPYWIRLLNASGFATITSDGSSVTIGPTTVQPTNYSTGVQSAVSFALLHATGSGGQGSIQYSTGTVGAATFNITSGERLSIDFAMQGLIGSPFIEQRSDNILLTGSAGFVDIECSPFVCKGINITMTDSQGGTIDVSSVNSITINTNTNVGEVVDPTMAQGFNVSTVTWDAAPTVSIDMAETYNNNQTLWNNFRNGHTIAVDVTFTSNATGNTIEFNMPRVEFSGITPGERNGFSVLQAEGKAVRKPGDTLSDVFNIVWTHS